MPPVTQSAIYADAGRYPALAFYVSRNAENAEIRAYAAALMDEVAALGLQTERILVALSPCVLEDHPDGIPAWNIEPSHAGDSGFEFAFGAEQELAVAVQVSAETPEDRVHALRLVKHVLESGGKLALSTEILSDVRTNYREAFGYPDNRTGHIEEHVDGAALIDTNGAHDGASWIFYQQLVQDVPKFYTNTLDDRNSIVGIDLAGNAHDVQPPADPTKISHVTLMRQKNRDTRIGDPFTVRRGFPFRASNGDEGLIFLGAASRTSKFKALLQAMLGGETDTQHDALLDYMRADAGGVFFMPATSTWLRKRAPSVVVRIPAEIEAIRRDQAGALELYPFTPAALAYMDRVRDEIVFGNPIGRIDEVPNPDDEYQTDPARYAIDKSREFHWLVAGGNLSVADLPPEMNRWIGDLGPKWDLDAPDNVKVLINALVAKAGNPPSLDEVAIKEVVRDTGAALVNSIQEANRVIASGIGKITPPVRDLINGTFHVNRGPFEGDLRTLRELEKLRDDAIDASKAVNGHEGYYITLSV